jgi:hypothetical protein
MTRERVNFFHYFSGCCFLPSNKVRPYENMTWLKVVAIMEPFYKVFLKVKYVIRAPPFPDEISFLGNFYYSLNPDFLSQTVQKTIQSHQ